MRFRSIGVLCVVCALLLLPMPMQKAYGQDPVEYKVQINTNDSAAWTITQVSDINGTVDTWDGFQQKVLSLVDAAMNQTHRQMSIDVNSLQMNTTISWDTQSKTTDYLFTWQNFSVTQNNQITFGDVFRINDFFSQLYGNGALKITYPSTYMEKSVSPAPDERDDSTQTLEWLGTQFFINGKPVLTLTPQDQTLNTNWWQQYIIVGLASAAAIAAGLVGFYAFRRRKRQAKEPDKTVIASDVPLIETEEEKILKVVRSSGGSIFQSTITEKCRFSKAKTSQLLAVLEKKGAVRRYKKGRNKIVTLAERIQGEQS